MRHSIVGAAGAAFAAVALATAAVASADPEEQFLATLEAGGFSWGDGGAQALIGLAHEICASLDAGDSAADIISDGANQTGWTGTQVGYFVGAAASEFCPQHLERAIEEAKTLGG